MTAILSVTMNPSIDVSASADKLVPVRKLRGPDVRRDPGGCAHRWRPTSTSQRVMRSYASEAYLQ